MASKTTAASTDKPLKSRFFRVATEGATTDGRAITRDQINQMAKNFDPAKYGARVWVEHMRGLYADSPFRAHGDVLAVEARDVEDGKRALFAQIKPLPELVAMNKAGQKIYTSIEVHPKFADSGEAYLTGLGVTDSPASLGTEVLTFAAQKPEASPFTKRKSEAGALFSEAVHTELVFEEDETPEAEPKASKFSTVMDGLVKRFTGKAKDDDARFAEVLKGFEAFGTYAEEQEKAHDDLKADHAALAENFTELSGKHDALVKRLEETPESGFTARPPASGGDGAPKTDC
ncbi:GPO family capsid scaffolding protein [Acidovorax sp. LjRoot194]|uniref:GPO family capsid scaffolding protein n=1 Tax=Acidovorax sp. LjRoot194 TaxID=3342280 RepID=UPI003ECDC0C1